MRPVNKGESPYKNISSYQEAEPYLYERIGRYCSFCELPIFHVPEVEHKEGRHSGGELTQWENLLYSCKYCNTRKAQKIKKGQKNRWLWPDTDNTFLAFTYENGVPKINTEFLTSVSENVYEKAYAIFTDLKLDFYPGSPKEKDKRWCKRIETVGIAEAAKKVWLKLKDTAYAEDELNQILTLAESNGFFSVWMTVFHDEPKVRLALISAFPGTAKECFDQNGNPVRRKQGNI